MKTDETQTATGNWRHFRTLCHLFSVPANHRNMSYWYAVSCRRFFVPIGSCFFPEHFHRLFCGKAKPLAIALSAIFLCVVLLILITLGAMWHQCRNRPANSDDLTVIVLGCEVDKTKPSVMLQARIDAAYAYLSSHPNTICIASGGMDDEEQMTEAQCIRDTLVAWALTVIAFTWKTLLIRLGKTYPSAHKLLQTTIFPRISPLHRITFTSYELHCHALHHEHSIVLQVVL